MNKLNQKENPLENSRGFSFLNLFLLSHFQIEYRIKRINCRLLFRGNYLKHQFLNK